MYLSPYSSPIVYSKPFSPSITVNSPSFSSDQYHITRDFVISGAPLTVSKLTESLPPVKLSPLILTFSITGGKVSIYTASDVYVSP